MSTRLEGIKMLADLAITPSEIGDVIVHLCDYLESQERLSEKTMSLANVTAMGAAQIIDHSVALSGRVNRLEGLVSTLFTALQAITDLKEESSGL